MHYIKDIFEEKESENAHNKFIRYSKGKFVGPLLKVKIGKSQIKLYGSFHFVDEFFGLVGEALGDKKVHITGKLVWNQDLRGEFAKLGIMYSKVTKSRGIFKYQLDNDVVINDFIEHLSGYNLLPTVKDTEVSIITKPNFPKPNKEFTDKFCKVVLPISMKDKVIDEFLFDVKDKKIKEAVVKHKILIDDIKIPEAESFAIARKLAKRCGEIEREVEVNKDSDVLKSKIKFCV